MAVTWLRWLLVGSTIACAAPRSAPVVPSARAEVAPVDPVHCVFEGRSERLQLRAPRAGFVAAIVVGAIDSATVRGRGESLRVEHRAARDGWRVAGYSDPAREDDFQLRIPMNIGGGVWVVADAMVQVLAARDGELEVGLSHAVPGRDQGYRFLRPIRQWVSCGDLRLAVARGPGGDASALRLAAGFPGEFIERRIVAESDVLFAQEPGGEPFFELAARERDRRVTVLQTAGAYSRALLQHYSGVVIVGWVATSDLQPLERRSMVSGILGALGGRGEAFEVCTSRQPIAVQATTEGHESELVAHIDPGTAFVREALGSDGRRSIRPHQAGLSLPSEDVTWSIPEVEGLDCRTERPAPVGGLLGGLRGLGGRLEGSGVAVAASRPPPDAVLRLRAIVTSASGLASLSAGDVCDVDVWHFPGDRRLACRASVQCGELTLFGERTTNGFFECEFRAGDRPGVEGRDTQTSRLSRDPAMDLNTDERSLRVRDDERGSHGAFELVAEIDSIEEVLQPAAAP